MSKLGRRRLAHRINPEDVVSARVARNIEPEPAAKGVGPAFEVYPSRVASRKEIRRPGRIIGFRKWARHVRGPTEGKFGFIANAAVGTGDPQHIIPFG